VDRTTYSDATLPNLLPPEIAEACRRQFGVPDRMLNAAMSQPILDRPRIVARVRQSVSARMAERMHMNREIEAGALRKPFNVPVNRIRGEGSATFGGEYEAAVGELSAKLT
jgi:hypothetical protein